MADGDNARMRIGGALFRIVLSVVTAMFAGCANRDPVVVEHDQMNCDALFNSSVRATLFGAARYWVHDWSETELKLLESGADNPGLRNSAPFGSQSADIYAANIAEIRDHLRDTVFLEAPFAFSPDGRFLAAIDGRHQFTSRGANEPKTRVVVVDLSNRTIQGEFGIFRLPDAIDWSPKGDMLVVLGAEESTSARTVRDLIAASSGHPVPYNDMYLTVVDLQGGSRCEVAIASGIPYGTGYVDWR